MSRKTPPARFRLRTEDGSEVPVSTVEALARRVSRGDVLPDTPLFDAGPGSWGRAADSTVVRFILDQLKEEGKEIPLEWSDPSALAPPPPGDAGAPAPAEADAPASDLDFDLTLADLPEVEATATKPPAEPPRGEAPPSEAAPSFDMGPLELVPMEPEPVEPDPPVELEPPLAGSDSGPASLAPSSSGGLLADDLPSSADGWKPPPPPPRASEALETIATEEPEDDPVVVPRRTVAARVEPTPVTAGGGGSRVWIGIVALVAVAVGAAGWFLFLRPDGDGAGDIATAPVGALATGPAGSTGPPPPAGSEGAAAAALARFAARMGATIDSLRSAHDLRTVPAREWLSGNYLANASDFAAVREFWVRYGEMVGALRARDRSVFQEVLAEVRAPGEAPGSSPLERYLALRYESAGAVRDARYEQLARVAQEAVRFHDFLLANESNLRYTPALGASIPEDPVLEMQASTPELRADLFARLDALLGALDRSRGGAEAPAGGLTVDLFEGFGAI